MLFYHAYIFLGIVHNRHTNITPQTSPGTAGQVQGLHPSAGELFRLGASKRGAIRRLRLRHPALLASVRIPVGRGTHQMEADFIPRSEGTFI